MERKYPYKAWVLSPTFKPVETEFREQYASYSAEDYGDVSVSGKIVQRVNIHATKSDAVEAGWKRVHEQEASLEKRQEAINKRRSNLVKYAA